MANLKLDLVNKLNNEKYFSEIELIRLAQDPNTNYKEKIEEMSELLETIVITNAQLGLVEQYFKEPAQENAPAPQNAPAQPKVNPGQSHSE
jgi:hypothetical protein